MKHKLVFCLSILFLLACEKSANNVELYAGEWNTISVLSDTDMELIGTGNYLSGYIAFEFTDLSSGNLLHYREFTYEDDLGFELTTDQSSESKFEILDEIIALEKGQYSWFGDEPIVEVSSDGLLHIFSGTNEYIFKKIE